MSKRFWLRTLMRTAGVVLAGGCYVAQSSMLSAGAQPYGTGNSNLDRTVAGALTGVVGPSNTPSVTSNTGTGYMAPTGANTVAGSSAANGNMGIGYGAMGAFGPY